MRLPVVFALASALFASAAALAAAAPPTSLDVTAKGVDFFSNRFIVTADGNVRVRLSDGTVVTGETFTMDLKLNRYLVAGNVHVDGPTIHAAGAAFAGYPDLDRSYFLPATASAAGGAPAVPERWTYYGLDWANPHVGREQPGDAFFFPDLSGERPYIYATGARITPKTNVLFTLPRVFTAGIYLPLPRYVVTFSANSHFYENGFQGARADVALPFNGSEHSLTALHARNDAFNGTYLALDQHFVWDKDWIVASIDPLTQEQRQYNLIAFKTFSPKLQARLFAQESAAQHLIINRPDDAAAFVGFSVNAGLPHSGLVYSQNNYYQHILGYPKHPNDNVLASDYDPRWREHPTGAELTWTGIPTQVSTNGPFSYRLRSGIGFSHDAYGEGGYPNEQPGPKSLFYKYVGALVSTRAIGLGNGYSLTAQYDKERLWFSLPHHVDLGDGRMSISRDLPLKHITYYVAYEIKTTGDYWGDQQLAAYPPNADVITSPLGPSYSGQAAFRGFATSRNLSTAVVYAPTPYFVLNVSAARLYDTPAPIPGVYGQPPVQLSADMRVRISKQLLVDVSRGYYFNFANERWTPTFAIQFSP